MTIRVAQWATGNTGIHALRALIDRSDMDLVGLRVFSDSKNGRDAGDIAGRARTGVFATVDPDASVANAPDCVIVLCADNTLADPAVPGSPTAQIDDEMCGLLSRGINVVATSVAPLTYPGSVGGDVVERLEAACQQGNASFVCIGIDPGFMNDYLPLALTGFSTSVKGVLAQEILNYGTYNAPDALRAAGYGAPPMDGLTARGVEGLLSCWGTAPKAIAAQIGLELDEVRIRKDFALATFAFDIPAFHVPVGAVAAQRFAAEGMVDGKAVVVAEHVTRLHDEVAPEWPRLKSGSGGFRVIIDGEPPMVAEIAMSMTPGGPSGDPCVDACHATAARAVNAIPLICKAPSGVHSQFTLPLITGRGLLKRG